MLRALIFVTETQLPDNSRDFSKLTNCSSDNAGDDYVPSDVSSTSDESVTAGSLLSDEHEVSEIQIREEVATVGRHNEGKLDKIN